MPNIPDVNTGNADTDSFPDYEPEANNGAGGATPNGSTFTPNPNNPLPVSTQEHIVNGNANGSKASGAHWSGSPNVQVDMGTAVRDPNGVFVANVRVADGSGNFVPKTNAPQALKNATGLANPATFFPASWTPERIIGEVAAAAKNPASLPGTRVDVRSPSGIWITIAKDASGNVRTAFPRWRQ